MELAQDRIQFWALVLAILNLTVSLPQVLVVKLLGFMRLCSTEFPNLYSNVEQSRACHLHLAFEIHYRYNLHMPTAHKLLAKRK
jgi:predicted CDP-diglyceride synthetase/phosphatidate cytidylyltransferase